MHSRNPPFLSTLKAGYALIEMAAAGMRKGMA
jgi:hypothetical protein